MDRRRVLYIAIVSLFHCTSVAVRNSLGRFSIYGYKDRIYKEFVYPRKKRALCVLFMITPAAMSSINPAENSLRIFPMSFAHRLRASRVLWRPSLHIRRWIRRSETISSIWRWRNATV